MKTIESLRFLKLKLKFRLKVKFWPTYTLYNSLSAKKTYLSMQIFSTCGTKTWSSLIIVCNGNLVLQEFTHSLVAWKISPSFTSPEELAATLILPLCNNKNKKEYNSNLLHNE